jgi:hypothetical protein
MTNRSRLARAWTWLQAHEGVAAALIYALVLTTAYYNVVFLGESLVSSNNLNMLEYRITERTHGPNFRPASDWAAQNLLPFANLHDTGGAVTQWEPGAVFFQHSLQHGEMPFWDPYVGGGAPSMSNLTPAFFFPPFLLVIALGNGVLLKNVYILALLLTGGWFTWALLRRSGLSWPASFVGGLTFMLCGGLNQTVGSILSQPASCIPVALLTTRWFLERTTWRAVAILAVVLGSIALASFPPVLSIVFGLSASYALIEIVFGGQFLKVPRTTAAWKFAGGCLLGVGLVAWYYFPSFALMPETPQVKNFYRDASSQTPVFVSGLLQLLSPTLMGGIPVLANDPIPRFTVAVFNYVGVVALLLVGLIGWREIRQPLGLLAAAGTFMILGLMFGFAPFDFIRELPGLHSIHFANYYGIAIDFLLSLLAAAGFERLRLGSSGLRAWRSVAFIVVALLLLILTALAFGAGSHPAFLQWRDSYIRLTIIALVAGTLIFAATQDRPASAREWAGWALIAVLAVEGMLNLHFPRQKRWEVWDNPPAYVEFLQKNLGLNRVFTMGSALYANAGSAFSIVQLDSLMMFNAPRIYELYLRYVKTTLPLSMRDARDIPPDPILDAANITHLTIATDIQFALAEMKARGYERVFDDGLFRIFRRPAPPRYFFTSEFRVDKKRYVMSAVGEPHPPREILVEEVPSFPARPTGGEVPVKVERFSNNHVRLSLVAPHQGFVYMSESFFPGWTAAVNGKQVAIEPANYAFRAVQVPQGSVSIELAYVPPGFLSGMAVSVAAFAIVVFLTTYGRRFDARTSTAGQILTDRVEVSSV